MLEVWEIRALHPQPLNLITSCSLVWQKQVFHTNKIEGSNPFTATKCDILYISIKVFLDNLIASGVAVFLASGSESRFEDLRRGRTQE